MGAGAHRDPRTVDDRGDVVRMGRQHIRDGVLSLRQEKTGSLVEIPVHPTLAAIIADTARDAGTMIKELGIEQLD